MDTTKAHQVALDDATLKSNEATIQVVTVSVHHKSLHFKMNDKSHTLNLENFRDMLQICLRLRGQKFEDLPLKEEILSFIRDLGHTRKIKVLTDVNANYMHQPWRQIYGSILPDELINQEIKDSEAYKQYYAIASGAEPPKAKTKYKKKADGSDTSSKPKFASTVKGKRLKTPVALSEHEQMKIATKRSKTQFHSSYASGSGDGANTQSEVPDEQQQKDDGTDEGVGDGPKVPDVPEYKSESEEESWTFSQRDDEDDDNDEHDLNNKKDDADDDAKNDNDQEEEKADDDDEVSSDQKVSTPPDHEFTEEEENQKGDDYVKEGEQEDEEEEMYGDLNLNLERRDVEMTDAQTNQDMEDVHVTLTTEPLVVQQQSSSVSSDLVSMYINPSLDTVSVATVTPSSVTAIPQTPVPIIQTLQQIPDSTTTTPNPTTTFPEIPNFASLFGFEQRVSVLETEMSEFKKLVKAQVSKILPKVKKYVTESLGAEVLVRSTNQPQTSYAVAASLSEFELKKILIDKIEENKSMNRSDVQKNLYNALIESYNSDKDIFSSYGDVVTLKRGRDDQDKDEDPSAGSN
ncbi:hypothetical protein Tco_1209108 [Tanacetum coccineum]